MNSTVEAAKTQNKQTSLLRNSGSKQEDSAGWAATVPGSSHSPRYNLNIGLIAITSSSNTPVQPKLKINSPNDKYEKEADRVADEVMRMSDVPLKSKTTANTDNGYSRQRKPLISSTLSAPGLAQRKCAKCEEEQIQTKSNGPSPQTASSALTNRIQSSKGGGQAMDSATQSFMSTRFGTDFSQVRIHTDVASAQMNQEIQARAFTSGKDVYFNRGEYRPHSSEGRRLLAHELTHVVQQGGRTQHISRQAGPPPLDNSCGPVIADSQEYSRGNNDQAECQYETARTTVKLHLDTCCNSADEMPLSVSYTAVLGGKSFTGKNIPNPSGSGEIREQEGWASAIASGTATPGRSGVSTGSGLRLREQRILPLGPANESGPLVLSRDDNLPNGIPGDPGDSLTQELSLGGVKCSGESRAGRINVGGYQRIKYSITADKTGIQAGSISLREYAVPRGRERTPLRNITAGETAYPTFPGTPRDSKCSCDPITGVHMGADCPLINAGSSVGKGQPTAP